MSSIQTTQVINTRTVNLDDDDDDDDDNKFIINLLCSANNYWGGNKPIYRIKTNQINFNK